MSEPKTLKIFEPLKTYFEILCKSGKCDDFLSKDCQELIDILTKIESSEPECVENFINALKNFAHELKKADTPIGLYTIKDRLKEIFLKSKERDITDIVENVDKSSEDLNGFKMDQDNGEEKTYKEILEKIISSNVKANNESIFNIWINESFPLYEANKEYFEKEIKPNLKNLDNCQMKILNDYFEVKVENSNVPVKSYIDEMDGKYNDKKARLNVKVDGDKAKIVELLPNEVREAFNKFLVTPQDVKPEFVFKSKCYVLEKSTEEPKEEKYKVPKENVEDILQWFEKTARNINRSQMIGINVEDIIRILKKGDMDTEDKDKSDAKPYEQDGVSLNFPSDFDVVRYENKWGLGLNGQLYKKEDGEFKLYPEDKLKADAESFKEKDGKTTCGHLCIFENPSECNKFFEKLIKGDELSMTDLSETINNANFASSYSALKTNIAEVNPLFVVGTLKLFGFQKYAQIDTKGRKIIKIESFTNWWNRQNKKGLKVDSNSFGSHETTEPAAPANVELFFKLLINFINSNEFVLNPRDKKLMTKSGEKPTITEYPPQPEIITWTDKEGNKHTYKNVLYKGEKGKKSERMSLSEISNMMKNNASFTGNSIGNRMSDNILNLSTLLGLMTHMTTSGNFSFLGKAYSPLSGMGYVGGSGDGDGDDDKKEPPITFLPCAAKAFNIYNEGKTTLDKHNKTFDETGEIYKKIGELGQLELEVASELETLASIVKIVNVLGDNKEEVLDSKIMNNLIERCGKSAEKCAKKSDSIIFSILEKIW